MKAVDDTDQLVAQWLRSIAPQLPPAELHVSAVAQVRRTRQQPRWMARLTAPSITRPIHGSGAGPALRVVTMAVVIGLLLTMGIVAVGGVPSAVPIPTATPARAMSFVVPLEYSIPSGSALMPVSTWQRPAALAWVEGRDADSLYGRGGERFNRRGIIVASSIGSEAHPCSGDQGRLALRSSPAAFLADLRLVAGAPLDAPLASTVDGRSALQADLTGGSCAVGDVHIAGAPSLVGFFSLDLPSRIISTDVDGQPILVVIWARTDDDLAGFMPTAIRFVDSLHFLTPGSTSSPAARPTVTTEPSATAGHATPALGASDGADRFVVPFEVTIPAGSPLHAAAGVAPRSKVAAWVEGPDRPARPEPDVGYRYGGQLAESGNQRGVIVASAATAFVHRCSNGTTLERYLVRSVPADFLADLQAYGGFGIGDVASVSLWGRSGVSATIDASANACPANADLHLSSDAFSQYILFTMPSRVIASDVDGHPIFILIWARTPTDLDDFMPTAMSFVGSFRFGPAPTP